MVDYVKQILWYIKNKNKVMYVDDSRSSWFKMLGLAIHDNELSVKYITGMYGYVDSACVNTKYLHGERDYYIYKYYAVSDINTDKEIIS